MTIEAALRASWEGGARGAGRLLPIATTPLSWAWRGVTAARNARWDRRPPAAVPGLRAVSVGNLAVGGTGKTPVSRWVVSHLRGRGARCAVVLSGYGEDEVRLHRRWHPDVSVLAGRDRRALMERARGEGAQVAVLDDGFQHRAAPRDLDLVLMAAEHSFPGPLLPRGRYREPAQGLARADLVVITRRVATREAARSIADAATPYAANGVAAGAALSPDGWLDLEGREAAPPTGDLLAVASVAAPEAFLHTVRAAAPGTDVRLRGFPDHHEYSEADVRRIVHDAAGRTIVTTEKDAVKLVRLDGVPASVRVVAMRLRWDWGEDAVKAALNGLIPEGA